ncbi:MAG: hypothetical protein Fur0023_10770 [Bacteroidia bacterium]
MSVITSIKAQNTFTTNVLKADSATIVYTRSDSIRSGTVRTDTLCSAKDLCVHQNAKISGDVNIFGNARLSSGSALVFEGNQSAITGKQINLPLGNVQLLSAMPLSVLSPTDPIDIDPCLTPTAITTPTVSTGFTAMAPGKGSVSLFSASWNGSGFLEVSGGNALLVNYFCGKDILLGTGTGTTETLEGSGRAGSKIYTGDYVEMRKKLQIGSPQWGIVNDPNNVALEVHTNSGTGIRVKTYTINDPEISVMNTNTGTGVGYNNRNTFVVYGDGKMRIRSFNTAEPMISVGKFTTPNGTDAGVEYFKVYADGSTQWIASTPAQLILNVKDASNNHILRVYGDGKMYFGNKKITTTHAHSDSKYQFDGKIACPELIIVDPYFWADDVFKFPEKLMSIDSLEKYIRLYSHLPDIPNEYEVCTNGIEMSKINALLLKKIEELTLYIIQLKKEILGIQNKNR